MAGFGIETRIAAISALSQLTQELISGKTSKRQLVCTACASSLAGTAAAAGPAAGDAGIVGLPLVSVARLEQLVLPALLSGLNDYSRDNRGDVGSWVREAAMEGTPQLLLLLGDVQQQQQQGAGAAAGGWCLPEVQALYSSLAVQLVSHLLQQSVERIARLRESALINLQQLLQQPTAAAAVPGAAVIAAALPGDAVELAGVASLACVPRLGALLQLPWYRRGVLKGLVASIGGVDASLAKETSAALLAQVGKDSSSGPEAGAEATAAANSAELRSSIAGLFLQLWHQEAG